MDVNLLKTRVKSDALNSNQTSFGGTVLDSSIHLKGMGAGKEANKRILINLLLIASICFAAKIYSDISQNSEGKVTRSLNAQIQQIEKKIQSKKNIAKEFSKFKVEGDAFERKILAVKELSKFRMHELKALDYMQSIVPEKLWFTVVAYKERLFNLKGIALEQQALTDFLREMENSQFFQDILILKSKEEKTKEGSEVNFELQAKLKVI